MKIIVGLGNPGAHYKLTRHNAGFLCMDFLQKEFGFDRFLADEKISVERSNGTLDAETVLLIKPTTFMNHSGAAVQALLRFYKVSPSDIAVIHDDFDIAAGTCRATVSSRSAGHNGVQNIIDILNTQDFFRIRIGIGHPLGKPRSRTGRPDETADIPLSPHDYVLQNFSEKEYETLTTVFPKVKTLLLHWLKQKGQLAP